jgi:glc operon protein GlcG
MTTLKIAAAASAVALLAMLPAAAQQPAAPAAPAPAAAPMPYGPPITLEKAEKAMAAAKAEAQKNNWPVAISIVDSGGHAVMFARLDNTQIGSIRIAEGKARTAVELRRPTKALQDAAASGTLGLRFLSIPNVSMLEGGVVIVADGKIIGGIGVSGVMSNQDAEVAIAGANAAK